MRIKPPTRARPRSKVLVVLGTRPEAIKLAPLVRTLRDNSDWFATEVCATAQHRSMLDQVLDAFCIKPDYDLDVMRPSQSLADSTARILTGLTGAVRSSRPDWIIVQGDTTTAFAGGLVGYYEGAKVGHVEAGLRTGDRLRPFPEEMNRRLSACLSDIHFAPTERARNNLLSENCPRQNVHVTGNTIVDALFLVVDQLRSDARLRTALDEKFSFLDSSRRLILVTGHRRESFGEPFRNVCHAFVDIISSVPDAELLYPVHLNPNVREPVAAILGQSPRDVSQRIHLIDPVAYHPFVYLMQRAHLIITDSGGVQEEAPSLGKPVLVTRDNTERPEALEAGTARLIGTDRTRIVDGALSLLYSEAKYAAMRRSHNPYGDGLACLRVVQLLRHACGGIRPTLPEFDPMTRVDPLPVATAV